MKSVLLQGMLIFASSYVLLIYIVFVAVLVVKSVLLQGMLISASIYSIVVISLERQRAITQPLKVGHIMGLKSSSCLGLNLVFNIHLRRMHRIMEYLK